MSNETFKIAMKPCFTNQSVNLLSRGWDHSVDRSILTLRGLLTRGSGFEGVLVKVSGQACRYLVRRRVRVACERAGWPTSRELIDPVH